VSEIFPGNAESADFPRNAELAFLLVGIFSPILLLMIVLPIVSTFFHWWVSV
jgi:hypothetical protein